MEYSAIYAKIIEQSNNRTCYPDVYYEKHHIIPRCMKGSDDVTNMALLTAKEHFICHRLLCHIYKNTKYEMKLVHAFIGMCRNWQSKIHNQERYIQKSSRTYEKFKKRLYGPQGIMKGATHYMYGRKHTKTSKELMSQKIKQYWQEYYEGKRPQRKGNTGYTFSSEAKEKMSETRKQNLLSGKTKNYMSKPCCVYGVQYPSIEEASRSTGMKSTAIHYRLHSKKPKYSEDFYFI